MKHFLSYSFFLKVSLVFLLFVVMSDAKAQPSNNRFGGIQFQAMAKDKDDHPAKSRQVYIEITILRGAPNGTIVYQEEFKDSTDKTGLFSLLLGKGLQTGGLATGLGSVNWANGPNYY